ncbi:MAG: N-acetyltransferase [Anaerolineae bacterium]|nr:N-acetyltransferase [Anaerolineae bacterium]
MERNALDARAKGDAAVPQASGVTVRPAVVADVEAIAEMINAYAARGEMLPKSLNQVYQNVRDFVVAEQAGRLIGCGALHVLWGDLAEIRSLAVEEAFRRRGIGSQIVRVLLHDARQLGLPQVFALTFKPEFFQALGFRVVDRESLPRKIWVDCIDCVRFPQCDEVAVILDLEVVI